MQPESIKSPYAPKRASRGKITKEEIAKIKELLGVECLFIVADTEKHDCSAETCTGHAYLVDRDGFSDDQFRGIIMSYAEEIVAGTEL